MEVIKRIGQNIQKRREASGLSQAELAKRCGYKTRSSISKLEAGINDVGVVKLIEIANVLEVNPCELIEQGGDKEMDISKNFYEEQMSEINNDVLLGHLTEDEAALRTISIKRLCKKAGTEKGYSLAVDILGIAEKQGCTVKDLKTAFRVCEDMFDYTAVNLDAITSRQ